MPNNSLNPIHFDYHSEGTSSTYTLLVNNYQDSPKGYAGYTSEGTSSTYTSLRPSGFQYLLSQNTVTAIVESHPLTDKASVIIRVTATETLPTKDFGVSNPVAGFESYHPLAEMVSTKITYTAKETMLMADSATGKGYTSGTEFNYLGGEIISTKIINTSVEEAPVKEFVQTINRQTMRVSVKFNCLVHERRNYSTAFDMATRLTNSYSVVMNGAVNQLVGVTASGMSSSGDPNPYNGSVVLNGTTIFGPDPAYPNSGLYVTIADSERIVTGLTAWSQLLNWTCSLNFSGGTFNLGTRGELASNGDIIDAFGLAGTVTDAGRVSSQSFKGYTTPGIFGQPLLNRQFQLLAGSYALISPTAYPPGVLPPGGPAQPGNLSGPGLNGGIGPIYSNQIAPNGSSVYNLPSQIAAIIAGICGINLQWLAADVPFQGFQYEATMNGMSALNSLAGRVGATLRWSGGNNYYVAYPNFTMGEFVIPHYKMVLSQSDNTHEDLETGVGGAVNVNSFGSPIQNVNIANTYGLYSAIGWNGSSTLDSAAGQTSVNTYTTPLVPVSGPITKKLTQNDPPNFYKVPANYQDIFYQVLIGPNYNANTTVPNSINNTNTAASNGITTDPSAYTLFVPPVFNADGTFDGTGTGYTQLGTTGQPTTPPDGYIFQVQEGGAYVTKLKVDYRLFPDVPAVNNGNFQMNFVATVRPNVPAILIPTIPPAYAQTYKGEIEVVWFGVFPLPGMWVSSTVPWNPLNDEPDHTVAGIIQSVSFTDKGTLQLEVAQYTRINWVAPSIFQGAFIQP